MAAFLRIDAAHRFAADWLGAHGKGLALAAVIAAAAGFLARQYGAPAAVFALLIGMGFNFLADDPRCSPGLALASGPLLRVGVALLGFRVDAADVAALGVAPFLGVLGLTALTIASGVLLSALTGRSRNFGLLVGGAVGICGASAALAIAATLPRRALAEKDVLFTVIGVTTLSSLAMVLYPLLFEMIGMDARQTGFLLGATIHDVAQVAAAGYSVSETTGAAATLVKLERVMLLPAALIAIAWASPDRSATGARRLPLPWFVLVFIAFLALNSLHVVPIPVRDALSLASTALLTLAIAALGVRTSIAAMTRLGFGHLATAVGATLILLGAAIGWAALAF